MPLPWPPPTTLMRLGLAVLARRKHYLEKPMAQSVAGCDALLRTWSGTNTFMVGLELRECVFRRARDPCRRGRPVMGLAIDNVPSAHHRTNHHRKKAHTRSLLLQKGCSYHRPPHWFMGHRAALRLGRLDYFGRKEDPSSWVPTASGRFLLLLRGSKARPPRPPMAASGADIDLNDNSQLSIDYDNGAGDHGVPLHAGDTREFTLWR